MVLSPNEARAIELLRAIKANRGHGELTIKVGDGLERQFLHARSELPPDRPPPSARR